MQELRERLDEMWREVGEWRPEGQEEVEVEVWREEGNEDGERFPMEDFGRVRKAEGRLFGEEFGRWGCKCWH